MALDTKRKTSMTKIINVNNLFRIKNYGNRVELYYSKINKTSILIIK